MLGDQGRLAEQLMQAPDHGGQRMGTACGAGGVGEIMAAIGNATTVEKMRDGDERTRESHARYMTTECAQKQAGPEKSLAPPIVGSEL